MEGSDRGVWKSESSAWVAAHEAGQLMGLPDAYVSLPDGSTHAKPGFEGTIMGWVGGKVSGFEIMTIMDAH